MRTLRLLPVAVLSMALAASAQTVVPVEYFRSVELHHGGKVTLRHGAVQRVTLVSGSADCTRIEVTAQRLVIHNGRKGCSHRGGRERLEIEVITPDVAAVSVSNGGTLQSRGEFPAHAAIDAAVAQGGTVDIRSIPADAVEASVYSGGRIFTQPRQSLNASVDSGGAITYLGDPRVRRSVRNGGMVVRATADEADDALRPHRHHSH